MRKALANPGTRPRLLRCLKCDQGGFTMRGLPAHIDKGACLARQRDNAEWSIGIERATDLIVERLRLRLEMDCVPVSLDGQRGLRLIVLDELKKVRRP